MIFADLAKNVSCEGTSSKPRVKVHLPKDASLRNALRELQAHGINIKSYGAFKNSFNKWMDQESNLEKVKSELKKKSMENTPQNIRRIGIALFLDFKLKDFLIKGVKGDQDNENPDGGAVSKHRYKNSKQMVKNLQGNMDEKIANVEKTIENIVGKMKGLSGKGHVRFVKFIYEMVREDFSNRRDGDVTIFDFGEAVDGIAKFYANRMSQLIGYRVAAEVLDMIDDWSSDRVVVKASTGRKIRNLMSSYAVSDDIQDKAIETIKRFLDAFESGKNTLAQTVDSISETVKASVEKFYESAWEDNQAQLTALQDKENIKFTADLTNTDPRVISQQIGAMRGD